MPNDMPLAQMPVVSKWRHYPTYVYEKNYACGINYYQPMIDYMDERDSRLAEGNCTDSDKPRKLPELPWTDGREIWENRQVLPYTKEELVRHATNAEARAKEHLSRFKLAKRSDFSLKKAVEATHVTKEVLSSCQQAKKSKMSSRIREMCASQEMDQSASMADLSVQTIRNMQMIKDVKQALETGKRLRARSARSIEFQLKADALKNIAKNQEQRESMNALREEEEHECSLKERARRFYKTEEDFERLDELTEELKTLECKSNIYFSDKR
ncbi:paramyosin, short form-like [Venturia canescens]|uniref:paramyosin, short form-like n=1 Tax=Venturia canescens TaxID=32260 RepID=UPI001C9BD65F|nr:paramyosin, short form-like [Venturia canescens]